MSVSPTSGQTSAPRTLQPTHRSAVVLTAILVTVGVVTLVLVLEQDEPAGPPSVPHASRMPAIADTSHPLLANDDAEQVRARGILAYNRGDFGLALEYFEDYHRQMPEQLDAHTYLAIARLMNGDLDQAERAVNGGLRQFGVEQSGPFYFVLACVQARRGEEQELSRTLDRAYAVMGPRLLEFAQMDWALHLQKTRAFQELLAREDLAAPSRSGQPDLPDPLSE